MDYAWHDLVGNVGVLLIAACYLANQTGRMSAEDMVYSVLNALGAALVLASLAVEFNLSAFIMEAFWLAISLYGIARVWRTARSNPP